MPCASTMSVSRSRMRKYSCKTPVTVAMVGGICSGKRGQSVEGPAVPEQMASSETQTEMLKFLSALKPIEADILRKRFGLVNDRERTLKEIGDEYRLSRERVRQLQEQALVKMRRAMAKNEAVRSVDDVEQEDRQRMRMDVIREFIESKAKKGATVTFEPVKGGAAETIEADVVLIATGRRAYADSLGLKEAGVAGGGAVAVVDVGLDDQVDDAGLVFEGFKDNAGGGAGPLADQDQSRHLDPAGVGGVHQLGGGQDLLLG